MRLAEVERFVGMPYCEATFDCADFVVLVQRELFGREVELPNGRPRGTKGQAAIAPRLHAFAKRTDPPADGDLVLMRGLGKTKPGHAGVYFTLAHEGWVLHSNETNGCSVLQRVRDLPTFGAMIEGFYTWAN